MSVANTVPSMGAFVIQGLLFYSAKSMIAQIAYNLSEKELPEGSSRGHQRMGLISALDGLIQVVTHAVVIYFLKRPDLVSVCPAPPLKIVCVIVGNLLSMGVCTGLGSDRWNFNSYLRSIGCLTFASGVVNIGSGLLEEAYAHWCKV